MACIVTPTATFYNQYTLEVVSTSYYASVTTISEEPITTDPAETVPLPGDGYTSYDCIPTLIGDGADISTACIPFGFAYFPLALVITTEVPILVTRAIVTSYPIQTLYGSSCETTGVSTAAVASTRDSTSQLPTSPTSTPSPSRPVSSGRPTIASTPSTTNTGTASSTGKRSVNAGLVAGSVIGGIFGLAILIFIIVFLCKKRPCGRRGKDDSPGFHEHKHISRHGDHSFEKDIGIVNEPSVPTFSGEKPFSVGSASTVGISRGESHTTSSNTPVVNPDCLSGSPSSMSSPRSQFSGGEPAVPINVADPVPSPPYPPFNSPSLAGVGSGVSTGAAQFYPNVIPFGLLTPIETTGNRDPPSQHQTSTNKDHRLQFSQGTSPSYSGSVDSGRSVDAENGPYTLPASKKRSLRYPPDVKDGTIFLNDSGYQVYRRPHNIGGGCRNEEAPSPNAAKTTQQIDKGPRADTNLHLPFVDPTGPLESSKDSANPKHNPPECNPAKDNMRSPCQGYDIGGAPGDAGHLGGSCGEGNVAEKVAMQTFEDAITAREDTTSQEGTYTKSPFAPFTNGPDKRVPKGPRSPSSAGNAEANQGCHADFDYSKGIGEYGDPRIPASSMSPDSLANSSPNLPRTFEEPQYTTDPNHGEMPNSFQSPLSLQNFDFFGGVPEPPGYTGVGQDVAPARLVKPLTSGEGTTIPFDNGNLEAPYGVHESPLNDPPAQHQSSATVSHPRQWDNLPGSSSSRAPASVAPELHSPFTTMPTPTNLGWMDGVAPMEESNSRGTGFGSPFQAARSPSPILPNPHSSFLPNPFSRHLYPQGVGDLVGRPQSGKREGSPDISFRHRPRALIPRKPTVSISTTQPDVYYDHNPNMGGKVAAMSDREQDAKERRE